MSQNVIIDEKDTSREKTVYFKSQAKTIAKNCKRKNINFYETENKESARILVSELVKKFKNKKGITKLGYADSVSLHQIEIFKEIEEIPDLNINNPLKRWPDGKYEVFGSQPPGKLNLPIDEYYKLHSEILSELLRVSKLIFYNIQIVTGSKRAFFKIIGKPAKKNFIYDELIKL